MKKKKNTFVPKLIIFITLLCILAVMVLLRMQGAPVSVSPAASTRSPDAVTYDLIPASEPELTPAPELLDTDAEKIVISEVMFKNKSSLISSDGSFPDWIELYNRSTQVVDISGWSVSDKDEPGWVIPEKILAPGEYVLIFASGKDTVDDEIHTDFTLSTDSTVYLFNKYGYLADSLTSASDKSDVSTIHGESESVAAAFSTPLYENTVSAYDAVNSASETPSGLIINEVMTVNTKYKQLAGEYFDMIELKNNSSAAVKLSDYALSDSEKNYLQCPLPDVTLEPGATYLVYCCDDETLDKATEPHVSFSLSSDGEHLYLSSKNGYIVDYVYLHDIPVNGSFGRCADKNGWYYFTKPTPGAENDTDAYKRVTAMPDTLEPDGEYNDVKSVKVQITGTGKLYYTLDGTVPTEASAEYTEPITVTATSIIRAIAVEDGCAPSEVATFSYFINENHDLPILSVVADNLGDFRSIWNNKRKHVDVPGNVAFYEKDGSGFSSTCGIHMKGWTSLKDPKKSIGVSFSGEFGGKLNYDVYGNGITEYSSLSIRGGQDYPLSIIRNELFQSLCDEMSDSVLTQQSKYCVLYVNGTYYGLYCLKEDITKQFYASNRGVSKDSVEQLKSPVGTDSALAQDIFAFVKSNSLAKQENYEYFCSKFDVDSLIDWFIMEGYCCNSDLNGNMRYYRSGENGNLWQLVFYDLDWTFRYTDNCFSNIVSTSNNVQIGTTIRQLLKNEEFVDRLLTRYAEVSKTVLSNENVLKRIDELAAEIDSEVTRDRQRYSSSYDAWQYNLEKLRKFVTDNDYEKYTAKKLCQLCGVDEATRKQYFGF